MPFRINTNSLHKEWEGLHCTTKEEVNNLDSSCFAFIYVAPKSCSVPHIIYANSSMIVLDLMYLLLIQVVIRLREVYNLFCLIR